VDGTGWNRFRFMRLPPYGAKIRLYADPMRVMRTSTSIGFLPQSVGNSLRKRQTPTTKAS
jgi:hypothetical protein